MAFQTSMGEVMVVLVVLLTFGLKEAVVVVLAAQKNWSDKHRMHKTTGLTRMRPAQHQRPTVKPSRNFGPARASDGTHSSLRAGRCLSL